MQKNLLKRLPLPGIEWVLAIVLLTAFFSGRAQNQLSPRELKKLSVEELMNVEVSLVSRNPEKLNEAASAIQVITGEDIRRSGATNIPEALRLVTNLQVAQITSNAWIISARGFNTIFANKLLVMIDGRTVYTPLFGGVIWEQQNLLLEEIDRIEVISGPGATLWGANAVNGVINIVTKTAKDSQGLYASFSAGNVEKDRAGISYGTKAGKNAYIRVYGRHFDRCDMRTADGKSNSDAWGISQGGFRVDGNSGPKDVYSLQGDLYGGERKTTPGKSPLNGQNIIGKWTHTISSQSGWNVQLYYDRYYRTDVPTDSYDKLKTTDLDFQYRFPLDKHQTILWGLGYRLVKDEASYGPGSVAAILPPGKHQDLFNAFIQDEISLAHNLHLTAGTKLLHNVYTGFEWQPGIRLSWIRSGGTLWTAVSRAVRTPSRFDVDYFLPVTPQPPTTPSVAGGPNFVSEKLIAYELGYRFQPNKVSSFSIASFYNVYNDIYSVEALPNTFTYQIQNGSKGRSWGIEFSGSYQLYSKWRLRGGYTYFNKDLRSKPGHVFNPDYLGNDARHQAMIQSILDLPLHLQLDLTGRYLDALHKTIATAGNPAYFTFDARVAWSVKGLEIAFVGQNLGSKNHTEFGTLVVPRGCYAKITTRF